MYIDYKRTEQKRRFRHRFFYVLAVMSILFSMSGCSLPASRTGEPVSTAAQETVSSQDPSLPAAIRNEAEFVTGQRTEAPKDYPETDSSQADYIRELTACLNDRYNVNILYGDMVEWQYGSGGRGITDEAVIMERLELLEECLREYPAELFADLVQQSPITINLIDSLDGADGYTDGRNADNIQIALSCENSATFFKLTFHHELFHFMEYYMLYRYAGEELLLYKTADYNDAGLYGTTDYSGTIYDTEADVYHQYFTSVYGKTNDMEDRAEIFSYYMGNTMKDCMKTADSPVTMKMKVIAQSLRLYCPSLSVYPPGTLPWESKIAY